MAIIPFKDTERNRDKSKERKETQVWRPGNSHLQHIDGRYFGKQIERTMDNAILYPIQFLLHLGHDSDDCLSRTELEIAYEIITSFNLKLSSVEKSERKKVALFPPCEVEAETFKPIHQSVSIAPDDTKINPERDTREIYQHLEAVG